MTNKQLFSTDTDDGLVSVVAKTGPGEHRMIKQIRVGNAPRGGVKFTKDGRGFVNNTSANTISEIDVVALEEVRKIEVGHGPRGLAIVAGDRFLLVSNSGSDTISIVDLELNAEVRSVPTGRDPRHMGITPDGRFAYICLYGEGAIVKLDISALATGDVAGVTEVARIAVDPAAHPYSLAITGDGSRIFVANTQADHLTVIDLPSDVAHRVQLGSIGGRAVAFTKDGKHALVTTEASSRVYVVDVHTLQVLRHFPVGAGPRGLVIDHEDNTLYASVFKRSYGMQLDEGSPDIPANGLTVVDLDSAPLDRQEGTFTTQAVLVGFGPCSVSMFDLDTIPADERARRAELVPQD